MSKRTREIATFVAGLIESNWQNKGTNDGVQRVYSHEVGLNEQDTHTLLTGRQVYIFAAERKLQGLTDRAEADNRHKLVVQVWERYTGTEDEIPKKWMDVRTDFVEDNIFLPFADFRSRLMEPLFPDLDEFSTIDFIYDTTYLTQHKAFFSQVTLYIQEVA